MRRLYLAFAALLSSTTASAIEIHTLYEGDCKATTGAIVDVADDHAVVLQLDGRLSQIEIDAVQLLARYDVLDNPFRHIAPVGAGTELLEVTSESSEGSFRAYATNFFEDLVLFLDDSGKIRVVETDEIVAIRRPTGVAPHHEPLTSQPVALVNPPGRGQCPAFADPSAGPPRAATQVLSDKLRLDTFWAHLRSGHRDLDSLRERTSFYARPLLFDRKSRLGIVARRSNRAEVFKFDDGMVRDLPLYLEFGGGSAYRFQNSTTLGSKSWRMAPQVRPIAGVRSEFKSHLLHGMFLGNLAGLTAGKPVFTGEWSQQTPRRSIWMDSSFNHLTLLGVDYGPWSLSYGYYFPTFAVGRDRDMREVTGTKASQVGRLASLHPDWQAELFLFHTSLDDDNERRENARQEDRRDDADLFTRYFSAYLVPLHVRLASTTVRLDLTLYPVGELSFHSDVVLTRSSYRETALRRNLDITGWDGDEATLPEFLSGDLVTNRVDQTVYAWRGGARMDLGKWVALGAEVSLERLETKGGLKTPGNDRDENKIDQVTTYVAMMELLL